MRFLMCPSGCGRTTVLRMAAGVGTPTSGAIGIGGQDVTGQRAIGVLLRAQAQFPDRTIAEMAPLA